jgi:hypothetical protein
VESRGFFAQEEDRDIFDKIRTATEKSLKEFSKSLESQALSSPTPSEDIPIDTDCDRRSRGRGSRSHGRRRGGYTREADMDNLQRVIKSRVHEIIRRSNASYAVILPLISIAKGGTEAGPQPGAVENWIEKELM